MSEEARVSSVFPEVRSAGGEKIKVEAPLLKSGIGDCTLTSTRARHTSPLRGGRERECWALLCDAFVRLLTTF